MKNATVILILICSALFGTHAQAADALEQGFRSPPDSAKPWMYWFWMNGNVTKEGITADLESMKRVGIGGALIFDVALAAPRGTPSGPAQFMTDEWRAIMMHTAKEADRLGVKISLNNDAGWCGSGGPWITPENGMQQLSISETAVSGPVHFPGKLLQPKTQLNFYRDIEVLAFPAPAGEEITMKSLSPKVTASVSNFSDGCLFDGNPDTAVNLPLLRGGKNKHFIQFEFAQPFAARSATILLGKFTGAAQGIVQGSEDGREFKDLQKIGFPTKINSDHTDNYPVTVSLGNDPAPVRFYRILFISKGDLPVAEVSLSSGIRTSEAVAKSGMTKRGGLEKIVIEKGVLAPGLALKNDQIINLTGKMKPDGTLDWDVPQGSWIVLRIGYTPIGMDNHPASESGHGLECDKMSTKALDAHWAGFMQKMVNDFGPLSGKDKAVAGAHIDSWEVGGQNWTAEFQKEFRQRRGYDPLPWLVTVTGRVVDNREVTERFLWDMRRTEAELISEKYYAHFQKLCHANGLVSSLEPYGGLLLQCGESADIPMGEFWVGRKANASMKHASTVGHIYGRTVIGAEAFSATPSDGCSRWLEDPYALKAPGDLAFCAGINRFVLASPAQQPWTNRWPGMTFGIFGTHFDRNVTWWEQGRAWMEYLARSQFMLQQGRFAADTAVFCGESALADMSQINPALPPGYDYDGISDDVLLNQAAVKDGQLVLKSGMTYRVLTLSQVDNVMTPKLLRKLRDFVADGLTLVGPPPERAPGLEGYPQCDEEIKSLVAELWGDCDGKTVTEHRLGKGKVVLGQTMEQVFAALNVKPDFEFAAEGGSQLAYIHRLAGGADIYFVSSQRDQTDTVDCTFRVSGKVPELWYPDTGRIEQAAVWNEKDGRITVPVKFDPAGSVFVVFRQPAAKNAVSEVRLNGAVFYPPAQLEKPAESGMNISDTFTVTVRVKPGTAITLPAETNAGIAKVDGQSFVFFPLPGHQLWSRKDSGMGISAGVNGIAVFEHSVSYLVPILVYPANLAGWTDIAVVYREGTPSLYVNGKLVHTGMKGLKTVHPCAGIKFSRPFPPFKGAMETPCVYGRALSADEIAGLQKTPGIGLFDGFDCRVVNGAVAAEFRQSGRYEFVSANGTAAVDVSVPQPLEVSGPWALNFPPDRGAPATVTLDKLISWTDHAESGVKYFSGTATYVKEVEIPAEMTGGGRQLSLDLGQVKNIAEVSVNGKPLGILWKPPFRADITGAVKPGKNKLEIKVTNLWPNRLIGDEQFPDDCVFETGGAIKEWPAWLTNGLPRPEPRRVTFTTWKHWKKDDKLLPSGLLGPVTIQAAEVKKIELSKGEK